MTFGEPSSKRELVNLQAQREKKQINWELPTIQKVLLNIDSEPKLANNEIKLNKDLYRLNKKVEGIEEFE